MGLTVANDRHHFHQLTMQIKLLDEVLGVAPSSKELMCLPIIFDITGDFGGSTVNDIARISDLPYSSVMRYIKSFVDQGLITYEKLFDGDRNKYITLTEKGEALKQRVFMATEDPRTPTLLDMQVDAREEALQRGHNIQVKKDAAKKAADTGEAQPVRRSLINYKLKTEPANYEIKAKPITAGVGKVGQATVKITPSSKADAKVIKSADTGPKYRERTIKLPIKELLNKQLSGRSLLKRLKENEIASSEHVMTQVIRAVRNSAPEEPSASWRGANILKLDPFESLKAFDDGQFQRIRNQGVWMLYEHGDNPAASLPVAVQLDFSAKDLANLLSEREELLVSASVADLGDITFGSVMKELKALLNANQYNKARTALTRAVADFSHDMHNAKAQHEEEVIELKRRAATKAARAEAMRSHASHPSISQSERAEFISDAQRAEGDKALAEASAEATENDLKKLQEQMAAMQAMLNKLTAEKDDDDA
jgi:DNA-binding MarR family transcriptional regulator